jgi:hypothetical protein
MAQRSAQPISRILGAVSPDAITTILLAAAGVLILAGVASAWLFLIRITA